MDELITKTEVKGSHGATDDGLQSVNPEKANYSKRKRCEVALYAHATIEYHLQAQYGSLEECRRLAEARSANARAATRERLLGPPAGWPVVGSLKGATQWAAIDTETSGLDPANGCRCIEIAAVIVDGGSVTAEWSTRINPGPSTTWEEGAMQCNGINVDDLVNAPTPTEAWSMFISLTHGMPLAAHNAAFDRKFIEAELATLGLRSENAWYCTMGSDRRRLGSLYYNHARRWIDGAHSALADAKAVAFLAPRLCR